MMDLLISRLGNAEERQKSLTSLPSICDKRYGNATKKRALGKINFQMPKNN
jgi:hypothetical protein